MSFILDALRKSDQTRQNNTAPVIVPTAPASITRPHRQPSRQKRNLAIILLCIATALFGWQHPWFKPQKNQDPLPQTQTHQATATAPPPSRPSRPAPQTRQSMATQTRTPQPAPVLATREKPPSQTLPPPQQTHDRSSPTAPVAIDELPPDLLAELPKISITAHSYSKKAKTSFIFANDRMLRENETLSPELQLENITPDGMIFNYKGYRFRRGLQP